MSKHGAPDHCIACARKKSCTSFALHTRELLGHMNLYDGIVDCIFGNMELFSVSVSRSSRKKMGMIRKSGMIRKVQGMPCVFCYPFHEVILR